MGLEDRSQSSQERRGLDERLRDSQREGHLVLGDGDDAARHCIRLHRHHPLLACCHQGARDGDGVARSPFLPGWVCPCFPHFLAPCSEMAASLLDRLGLTCEESE